MTLGTASTPAVGVRRTAADLAALVRLPNLFTAPPDVVAGATLAVAVGGAVDPLPVAGLCVASAALYAGGTTLNDVADVAEDARERPERPIPSGAVSRRTAAVVGAGFLGAGVVVAAVAGGVASAATAVALAAVVGLYDLVLKGGPAGPLAMGAARGLNVALGLSAAGRLVLDPRVVAVPVVLGTYVAALTWMAESETGDADRTPVAVTAATAVLLAAVVTTVVGTLAGVTAGALAAVVGLGFVAWVGRPLVGAYADPTPETIGPAVGAAVLGIGAADAAVAAAIGPLGTVAAIAFLVPAVALARRFEVT
jgi:4-hydroxybenzoate polyprenyltransferase